LFVARCFSQYVKDNGILSFLIPFNVLKTQGGAGFRKYLVNNTEVIKIHELSELYPFEGATNRTGLIVIKHGKTKFPIKCKMWSYHRTGGVPQELDLIEVKKITKQFDISIVPIETKNIESPWSLITPKLFEVLKKVVGPSEYRGYAGVFNGINNVYWIYVKAKQQDRLVIENVGMIGKKKVKKVTALVEKELVYPLLRGRDVNKWFLKPSLYIILPVDKKGETLDNSTFKTKFPDGYKFFNHFFDDLIHRSGEPYKSQLAAYREKYKSKEKSKLPPFYMLFNVEPALSKYKVIWKDISGKISAKGEFGGAVVAELVNDKYLGRIQPIPDVTLMFIPSNNEEEAHYLCSILNSSLTQLIVTGYSVLHVSTHVVKYLGIKKFNPKDELHLKLSELSKKAHELAKKYYEQNDLVAQSELKKVEEEIDKTVAKLYGITDEELEEIKKTLKILKEGEVEEEEENEEEEIILPKAKDIDLKVEPLFIEENETNKLSCIISNNSDKPLSNVKTNVYLGSESLVSESIKKINEKSFQTINFNSPKLKPGEYELRIVLDIGGNKIEEKRKLFVGSEKKAKKVKSILDEEIERVLK